SRERAEALLRIAKERLVAYHGEKVLFHRGIQPATISKVEIGYCDQFLADRLGLSDAYRDRIVFPARSVTGDLIGLKFHRTDQATEPKSLSLPGSKGGIFIAGDIGASDTVYITEGEIDATLLYQVTGVSTLTGTGGSATVEAAWAEVLRDKNALIFYDADSAGEQYANRWTEILKRKAKFGGCRSLSIRGALPDGMKDVSDCIMAWASGSITMAIEHASEIALPPIEQIEVGLAGEDELIDAKPVQASLEKKKPKSVGISLPEVVVAETIAKTDYPPIEYLVEGVLPSVGLGILVGRPKCGKSWMSLQIAESVATGKPFLDYFPVPSTRPVLVLDLEGSARKAHPRINRFGGFHGLPVHFCFECPSGTVGLGVLKRMIDAHRPSLIIIDTLQVATGIRGIRGATAYESDYVSIKSIKDLAYETETAIFCLHHPKKGEVPPDNPAEAVNGSTGILGAADTLWILDRPATKTNGVLHTAGREIEQKAWDVQFEDCAWSCLGEQKANLQTETNRLVIGLLKEVKGPIAAKEIISFLKDDGHKVTDWGIRSALKRMVSTGEIIKELREYRLP
ncbi:MAG: hypothetical protein DYH02_08295, partial [Candidatus Omnitrophica bacterium COP1]|nr:hypothetical protein [Candidatus Omnitrophica bacterium COP1]